ncbi:phage tail termination protein [Mycobacteroides abscessus]
MVTLPGWFKNNFVNVENLMIDIFTKVFPDIESGCWTPEDWLDQVQPDPVLKFFRMPGGRVDWQRGFDECFIQATAVTNSRDESWDVMSVVRAVLLPMQGYKFTMADGFTAQIHTVEEVLGPQLLMPNQQLDTRVVNCQFRVSVGLRSRDNYLREVAAL